MRQAAQKAVWAAARGDYSKDFPMLLLALEQVAKTVSEYEGMVCKWQGAYSSEATWHETI
jgi:hypothetical protein